MVSTFFCRCVRGVLWLVKTLLFLAGRFSMGCTNPHFMDYIDHAEGTRFTNEDARDNSSLLRLPFEVLSVYWSLF